MYLTFAIVNKNHTLAQIMNNPTGSVLADFVGYPPVWSNFGLCAIAVLQNCLSGVRFVINAHNMEYMIY